MPSSRAAKFAAMSIAILMVAALAAPATGQEKPTAAAKQKHMMRFSFKAGTVRHTVMEQDLIMTVSMGKQEMVTKLKTTMWVTTTVKATEGNIAHIEQVITRVKAFADGSVLKLNFDSDDEDSDPGSLVSLASFVGKKTVMKLSDRGKAIDTDLSGDETRPEAVGTELEHWMAQGLTQLPDRPIAIAEPWKLKQKVSLMPLAEANPDAEMAYKLLAVDSGSITVQQRLIIDLDTLELPGAVKPEALSITGTSKLDLRTGTPIEGTQIMKSTFDGQTKMTMHVTQTIKLASPPKKLKKPSKK
tara:strand:+ start:1626 stop:2528 length:903 start_codon:yes stop_codon:yes gene_type:complete